MAQIVLPGDQLGFSEEFVAGSGAFEKDGVLYAAVPGEKSEDATARTVGVAARKTIRSLKQGDVVYGVIEDLMETIAIVRFEAVAQGSLQPVSGTESAYLRVSEILPAYVESIRDYIRTGDIIRARVLEVKNLGTYLTLKGREFGVVKAFCSRCRSELQASSRFFVCAKCGNRESRKTPEE